MGSQHIFQDIPDGVDIRQGDIICRRGTAEAGTSTALGVIITADCDIAQSKIGEHLSYLEMMPANEYISGIWVHDELRANSSKQLARATEGLNSALRKRNLNLSEMTNKEVLAWLQESTVEEISAAIGDNERPQEWHAVLRIVQIAEGFRTLQISPFERLVQVWDALHVSEQKRKERVSEALNSNKRNDIVFVPSLPMEADIGFVVLLRAMRSIKRHDLHLSALDARLVGRTNDFYRLGRFSDTVRHSISQRMAFLFSRIGLSTAYEADSKLATDMFIEGLQLINMMAEGR